MCLLVVGHGSRGTTMRALHGLPIVRISSDGVDQVPMTRLIEQ